LHVARCAASIRPALRLFAAPTPIYVPGDFISRGTFLRRRFFLISAAFAVALAIAANLAWLVAVGMSDPWFSAEVSLRAYTITFALSSVLASVLATLVSTRAFRLDESLEILRAGLHAVEHPPGTAVSPDDRGAPGPISEEELEELSEALDGLDLTPFLGQERSGHDSLAAPIRPPRPPTRRDLGSRLRAEFDRLHRMRERSWRVAGGPLATTVLFAAISGALLPVPEAFAASDPQLNTALILFFAYGWPILAGWVLAAIAADRTGLRGEAKPRGRSRSDIQGT
jgi:hypothetical protein